LANPSLDKYKKLIKGLFPQGWAWNQSTEDDDFNGLIEGLAAEAGELETRAIQFITEMDPNQTFEMLDNWERLLGIPDECTPSSYNPSLFERRQRVLQKLTTGGGQSKTFFQLIIQQLGYDTNILDVVNFKDFRAGEGMAGERITNSTTPAGGTGPAGWAFAFAVLAPATLSREFRAGQGSAGDRLRLVNNETLECVVKRFAPAHTTALFFYT
jgi:uncharacterized protein YmfQ (DUF2313 family)